MTKPASQDHHDQSWMPPLTTMYVEADAKSFRELVQRLTGPSDVCHHQICTSPQATETANKEVQVMKGAGAKRLHERRSKLEIIKPSFQFNLLSPAVPTHPYSSMSHDNSSCIKNPSSDAGAFGGSGSLNSEEEEKAIKERRFYLHPSPRSNNKQRVAGPELLTLFPLTSPKTTNEA